MIFNLPNIISFSRVIVAPLFIILMLSGDDGYIILACYLYVLAAFSDYIDGWYARKYNLVTKLGIFFDPLADKILTTACFVVFVCLDIIPLWMVIIIVIRDFGTTFMRIMSSVLNYQMDTSISAKTKTTIQMIFIGAILCLIFIRSTGIFELKAAQVNKLLYSDYVEYSMFLLVLITVWTLIEYFFYNKLLLSQIWSYFTKKKLAND